MRTRTPNATKTAVLNAAERLFAERGFERTSLRMITAAADANLGAVNYHFATKEDLIVAVLQRRMRPINAERLALLQKLQDGAKGKPLDVRKILEALFSPAIAALTAPSKGGKQFLKLIPLMLSEPGASLLPLVKEEFGAIAKRFHAALKLALPRLSDAEIYWRLHFSMGAFVHTVAQPHVLRVCSQGMCSLSSIDDTLHKLVEFCAGGFEGKNDFNKGKTKL